MNKYPLTHEKGYLFITTAGKKWLMDTGAPFSIGDDPNIELAGNQFILLDNFMGTTASALSGYIGTQCAGLIGMDILGNFDHILDLPAGEICLSLEEASLPGHVLHLDTLMGSPVIKALIGGEEYRMFLDTGAEINFFQGEGLTNYPPAGTLDDFHPIYGNFTTDTYELEMQLSGLTIRSRCGVLPGLLGTTLTLVNIQGIIGNPILLGRRAGYYPRRNMLVL